ncbi:MAG: endonuclease/exonuclease/phosphatase family protein [Kiritimatiellae bacterium]|nr:endonuclease/exonuclease/phosphatase family protein [Kiritimatiellia bacterium]
MTKIGFIGKAKQRTLVLFALFVLWLLSIPTLAGQGSELVVASWNVENLFDTEDDPDNPHDDGYTPQGWANWSEQRYQVKLDHLAEVIAEIKPAILCLVEVENRRVLEDLRSTLLKNHNFKLPEIIHRDGGDVRGIDVALMAKFVPENISWFRAISGQRDVLACDFSVDGHALTIMVNHWKSKLGTPGQSNFIRQQQAQSVRDFIDLKLSRNPGAAILAAGDFNADIDEAVLTETAGFLLTLEELQKAQNTNKLYNLAAALPARARATYYYAPHEKWNSLDSISASRGMVGVAPLAPWRVKPGSYTVHNPAKICFTGLGSPLPYRRVRSKRYGDRFVAGYSDHFAIYVTLELLSAACQQ